MEKITFCIPSKSNLRYLKTCIPSIRKNANRDDHQIIIFVDSDEDGTIDWLKDNKTKYNLEYYINPKLGVSLYGIGKAYDFCIEKSNTDIFMIFHADMILGKNADLYAYQELRKKTVVSSTRIEPPIHPNGGEKIQVDFGMYPEEFKESEFNTFVEEQQSSRKTTEGVFAPWMMYKEEFLSIGGHDPKMHSCREDSDIFNRLLLDGFTFKQSWSSLVYHFTGRGAGSFEGDSKRHEKWKKEMFNSTKEFIRKWGTNVLHTSLMKPIVAPKYDIGIRLLNANSDLLELLEPWCSNILIDDEMQVLTSHYIDKEQKNTAYSLKSRIKTTPFDSLTNDVVVTIDKNNFNQETFQFLQRLQQILENSGEEGRFELGTLIIDIKRLVDQSEKLIKL